MSRSSSPSRVRSPRRKSQRAVVDPGRTRSWSARLLPISARGRRSTSRLGEWGPRGRPRFAFACVEFELRRTRRTTRKRGSRAGFVMSRARCRAWLVPAVVGHRCRSAAGGQLDRTRTSRHRPPGRALPLRCSTTTPPATSGAGARRSRVSIKPGYVGIIAPGVRREYRTADARSTRPPTSRPPLERG